MKKYFLLAIGGLLAATLCFAQTSTEQFETETDGNTSFTDNGVIFNIVSNTGRFFIQTSYPNTGWNGTTNDNAYIDNSGNLNGPFDPNAVLNSSLSIRTTSNLFKVNRFWVFLGDINANPGAATGTLNITGKLGTVVKFNQTKTTGFTTSTSTNNGYTLIDLTNLNGQNYTNIVISELQLTIGGTYRYFAVDAFTWVKDAAILPVTFGEVNASVKNNSLSVNWTTEKETSNDHFEIEASTDGKAFKQIATVASKATDGNSDITLNYDWTFNGSSPLAALPILGLLLVPLSGLSRKKAWMLTLLIVGIGVFTITGCSKSNNAISNNESYYIRVAQVDKDGTTSYSKVVKVQQDQ